jgi:DNA primase
MELSPIEEIKSRLDIVEVIGSYLNLKKMGSNYVSLCPFHSEKKPSFFVSPRLQIFKCFGCGLSGDIFKFVMLIEGVEFGDALRILAQRAGVELKKMKPEWKTERKRMTEICELATRFFEKQLEGRTGKEVVKYLLKRKISQESIKKWRIGWAPQKKDALLKFLSEKGYKKEEVRKAGLAFQKENGEEIDFFRGRIVFPIFDLNSQVIGFAGRIFKTEEGPKYLNSPNTLLYDKSKVLYGLDKARLEIRKKDFTILVEGYTDTILAHQEGFENTVSASGTALTPYQLNILKRYSQKIYFVFDADLAGELATKRGIDLAQLKGFEIKVVLLPEGMDPADLLAKNPETFKISIEKALSILEFYFQTAFSRFDKKTIEGKKAISQFLLPVIKRIQNEIEKSHWLSVLAKELKAREEDLRHELEKIKTEEEKLGLEEEEISNLPQKSRQELLQEHLLFLILKSPEKIEFLDDLSFFDQEFQEIFSKLKENPAKEIKDLSPQAQEIYNENLLKSEIEEIEEEKILPEIKFCLREIKVSRIKTELSQISQEIREAEEEKNFEKAKGLIEKFNQLSKKLNQV